MLDSESLNLAQKAVHYLLKLIFNIFGLIGGIFIGLYMGVYDTFLYLKYLIQRKVEIGKVVQDSSPIGYSNLPFQNLPQAIPLENSNSFDDNRG